MPTPCAYDYAVIRVVPRVEREEFINAGVILSCPGHDFLEARLHLDARRLAALCPALDARMVQQYLDVIARICRGEAAAGPIGLLPQRQRFYWLVAPRSTIIQTSAVHSGLAEDPAQALDHLLRTMVHCPDAPHGSGERACP